MRLKQRDLYQQLRAEAIETRDRIASMVRPLDLSKINEHPEPNGWSVGQVLEHLYVADERYEAPLAHLLATARRDAAAPEREWKPSFIGGMIAGSLLKPKPLKSPRVFRPGPTPRDGVVEALISREMNFVAAMDEARQHDWRALRINSPALWSWAPKMNLGDGFRIHIVHLTRHSHQIERLVGKL
ncbi:MAG: DinB family protein [Gemmatimonadaceae bacterium]